ncbi:methyltransferase domain-containing protein [Methylobacterium sp. ID0610]|uniref:methyltransferase domain-containing protein n=1 Tax=Methylobacterium carpenticola TaxID=3344827 RepID=UPI003685A2BA
MTSEHALSSDGASLARSGRSDKDGARHAERRRSLDEEVFVAFGALDRELFGQVSADAAAWNRSGGARVATLLGAILTHVAARGLDAVHVLNMSGLNQGKPDPVLFDLAARELGPRRLSWTVVDHPQSQTFTDPTIRGWLDARGIARIGEDFRDPDLSVAEGCADVVLCTEILEHLDYTVAMRLLRRCQRALRPGGLLIITTPNAVCIEHRIRFALGHWDFLHFMDDPDDVERGLLGHIMYYDGARLTRVLRSLGFGPVRASTFNAGHGPGEYRNPLTRAAAIALRALSWLLPRSGQVLLVCAEKPAGP